MKNKSRLSFDLTSYMASHPEVMAEFNEANLVIFVEGKKSVNQDSQKILLRLKKKGETAVKAIRKNTSSNKWIFETA